MHILVILEKDAKPQTTEELDRFISAEIPDEKDHPEVNQLFFDFYLLMSYAKSFC